jgi:hypothetical protein
MLKSRFLLNVSGGGVISSVPEGERPTTNSSQGDWSQLSDAPARGMGDLGDQAVGMTTMEKAADLGALALRVGERFEYPCV